MDEISAARQRLRQAMQKRLEAELLPYQGQWLSLSALESKLRGEKRASWVRVLELTMLYMAGGAVSLLMLIILWNMVY